MKIFVDMDMVLVNFRHGVEQLGYVMSPGEKDYGLDEWMEGRMQQHPLFWETLPPMEDYHVLWENIFHLDPHILSAYPKWTDPYVHEGKRKWCVQYLNMPLERVHIVSRKDKAKYAQLGGTRNILIDDRTKNIKEFIDAGGIGVLHYDAHSTVQRLKDLGILNR